MDTKKEKKAFSVIARIKSANHAWRGVGILIKNGHNTLGHIVGGLLAIYLGFILNISQTEWLFLFFAIGLVMIAEAINTAIEVHMDLTSPEYHPHARDTKDVAAGAVLISVILSILVAIFIFLPKILSMIE